MALATGTDAGNVSSLGDISQLISALSPIFLGTGKTVGTGTTATTAGTTGQTSQSLVTGADPGIIATLLGQLNQANAAATDPSIVQGIISNIIHQNLLAFAPSIGTANEAGIYNSSTLGLLAGEAASKSVAQAASSALNFQTTEQQIASTIGNNLLQATKTQAVTGTDNKQTAQTTQTADTKVTQPIVGGSGSSNLLTGLLGLGLLVGGKSLGITGDDGLLSKGGDLIKNLFGGGGTETTDVTGSAATGGTFGTGANLNADIGGSTGLFGDLAFGNPGAGGLAATAATPFLAPSTTSLIGPSGATLGAGNTINIPSELAGGLNEGGGSTAASAFFNNPDIASKGFSANFTTSEPVDITGLGSGLQTPSDAESLLGLGDTVAGTAGTVGEAGASNFFSDAASSVSDFIKTGLANQPGSILNLPSDIGNVLDTGSGFGAVAGDLANPVAGFAGGELARLIRPQTKEIGGSIGGTVGGIAGGIGGGALLGSELGSFAGPIGTAAGALIGTLLGGLVGPNPKNSYFYLPANVSGGKLSYGQPTAQSIDAYGNLTNFQQQAVNFNTFLDKTGLRLSSIEGQPLLFGTPNPHGNDPIPTLPDIASAFSKFRFTSDNADLNNIVSGVSFSDPNQLLTTLTSGQKPSATSAPSTLASTPSPSATVAPPPPTSVVDPTQFFTAAIPDIAAGINPNLQTGGTG